MPPASAFHAAAGTSASDSRTFRRTRCVRSGGGADFAADLRADDTPVETQLVDIMNKVFGKHPGFRANHAKGIVTEGDINRVSDSHVTDVRDYSLYHRVADLPIGEIMTRNVVTVTPDTPILEVARLLLEYRIGGVPVVEDGQVVGVITESDLFRLIVIQQAEVV